MVARGLRLGLAVQALGVALYAFLLVRFAEISPAMAAAVSFAALLGVYLLFTLATFAICRPRECAVPEQKIGFLPACRTILAEWLAFFTLFAVIQPFADSVFSVKGAPRRTEKLPVMLVARLPLQFGPVVVDDCPVEGSRLRC